MNTGIHPLARKNIKQLPPQELWQRYQAGVTEKINTSLEPSAFASYPAMDKEKLKIAYADILLEREGIELAPSYIHFTSGLSEAIDLIVRCFAEPGMDKITITSPTFPLYERLAGIYSLSVQDTRLTGNYLNIIDIEALKIAQSQITFICNPSNPLGTTLSWLQVKAVCESVPGIVVVDEAYIEYADDTPSAAILLKSCLNLIVLRTFSKAWGLAGVRVGAVLAHPSVHETLKQVQCPFSVNSMAQSELKARLQDRSYLERSRQATNTEKKKLTEQLKILPVVKKIYPSSTNFILAELDSFSELMVIFKSHQCLVTSVACQIPKSVRISIGKAEENDFLVSIIKNSFSKNEN